MPAAEWAGYGEASGLRPIRRRCTRIRRCVDVPLTFAHAFPGAFATIRRRGGEVGGPAGALKAPPSGRGTSCRRTPTSPAGAVDVHNSSISARSLLPLRPSHGRAGDTYDR